MPPLSSKRSTPMPCDPNPYRTIASTLAAMRANQAPLTDGPRSKAALRSFLERNAPSSEAARERDARVANAQHVGEAFRATARRTGDYATSTPHVAPNFSTKR